MDQYEHDLASQLERISQAIRARGLGAYEETLLARRQPTLKITMDPADILPIGCSKFGGKPDLPPDFVYPRYTKDDILFAQGSPLTFLVQYRLKDFAPFVFARELLPPDGMLYFFGLGDESGEIYYNYEDSGRVIYWQGDVTTLRPYDPGEEVYTYKQAALKFEPTWSLGLHLLDGYYGTKRAEATGESRLADENLDFLERFDELNHRALGLPTIQQPSDVMEDEEQMKRLVLLLQLDYAPDLGLGLGDAGTIYFLVPAKDLRERVFENIWFEGACG
ncbi:YwqG family protein [Ktedonobacter racemifer]|uniref:DUF1963 domain-containing protein n=1 Tax=Ktedonobacter racemifer DSM 44963 TaxID=485913 RepID=D6U8X4_KTERA|nr:YwqG family protein [Ktedonobacter racemifer]EFH79582.1 Protein of unknown function DUF1963 [Ktedonobacter racemifer DSM 44963]